MEHTKANLRQSIRSARKLKLSHFKASDLDQISEFKEAAVIASYRSYGTEPDTTDLNRAIIDSGKRLLLPALLDRDRLEFREWDGDTYKLIRLTADPSRNSTQNNLDAMSRLEEPLGDGYEGRIDIIFVPALAIDKFGNRLGQGGGYYDRFLNDYNGLSIALVGDDEFLEQIPSEPHDARVKAVLTPTRLIRF